jgi:hypothetical protein
MRTFLLIICLGVVLTTSIGCTSGNSSVVPVSGVVTYKGQPVPGMRIAFQPDQGRGSTGTTAQDGSFEMYFTRDQKGVQVGRHEVKLDWSPEDEEGPLTPQDQVVEKVLAYFDEHGPLEIAVQAPETDLKIELP